MNTKSQITQNYSFFPSPYPDELVYSQVGRYHIHTCSPSFNNTVLEIFSKPTKMKLLLSQNYQVYTKSPVFYDISYKEYLEKYTLLPFYMPFLRKETINKILRNNHFNSLNFKRLLGESWTGSLFFNNIYYCEECIEEQINTYGEFYWTRTHQIPTVFICPIHKKILKLNRQSLNELKSTKFVLPVKEELSGKESLNIDNKRTFNELYLVSLESYNLLNNIYSFPNIKTLNNNYKEQIEYFYYKPTFKQYNFKALKTNFVNNFTPRTLQLLGVENDLSWLSKLFNSDKTNHPRYHILLTVFLFGSFEGLIKSVKRKAKNVSNYKEKDSMKYNYEQNQITSIKAEKRVNLIKIIDNDPGISRTFIMENYSGLYKWLSKHDRDWLIQNLPNKKIPKSKNKRQYERRKHLDEDIFYECQQIIRDWCKYEKSKGKLIRKTNTSITSRGILARRYLGYNHELPLTTDYLKTVTETNTMFRIRRLENAYKVLKNKKLIVRQTDLLYYVNIKISFHDLEPEVKDTINRLIYDGK